MKEEEIKIELPISGSENKVTKYLDKITPKLIENGAKIEQKIKEMHQGWFSGYAIIEIKITFPKKNRKKIMQLVYKVKPEKEAKK